MGHMHVHASWHWIKTNLCAYVDKGLLGYCNINLEAVWCGRVLSWNAACREGEIEEIVVAPLETACRPNGPSLSPGTTMGFCAMCVGAGLQRAGAQAGAKGQRTVEHTLAPLPVIGLAKWLLLLWARWGRGGRGMEATREGRSKQRVQVCRHLKPHSGTAVTNRSVLGTTMST